MSEERREIESLELHARVLYDIAHLLESAEGSEGRIHQAIELLRQIVPYDQCTLLEAGPGRAPRVVAVPEPSPDERALLGQTLLNLLAQLVEDRARAPALLPAVSGPHLAVPLLALDQVTGILLVRRAGGEFHTGHLRALSVVGAQLAAYLIMLRNRAEDAERARELEEARRTADAANQAKDQFLALVSHELKTPLSSTLTWVHVLRSKSAGADERTRAIDGIERNVRTEAKLIDDLLDLSCIATAELRLDLRAIEPVRLIKAAIEELRPRAERRLIRVEAALDGSVKTLIVDPQRLDQVIAILLANAIQFTPDGGHVEVHLERAGPCARIQVIDSGRGINSEFLPHVFEVSPPAGSAGSTHGASGLQLAVVKHLVELHGGSIQVESLGEEKGTTFTVELPLSGPQAPIPRGQTKEHVLDGIRVLVVDDDPDMREALRFVLEYYGAEVTVAASVAEALSALERAKPDVLLSDLAMPGESGLDLMVQIAEREGGIVPPAAALTAYSRDEDRDRALAAGFRMHLVKPIAPDALVSAVALLAGRSLASDRVARPPS
jgi:signal transduction histidine kinase/ActR/RegA family two-component response regulator